MIPHIGFEEAAARREKIIADYRVAVAIAATETVKTALLDQAVAALRGLGYDEAYARKMLRPKAKR